MLPGQIERRQFFSANDPILTALQEAVVLFDEQFRMVFLNPAAETLFGGTLEDVAAGATLRRPFREDGTRMPPEEFPARLALQERRSQVATVGFLGDDGMQWLHETSEPLFRAGATEPYAVVALFTQVTPLIDAIQRSRESDELARAIMAASFEAVILFGDDGSVINANRAAERMFGRTSEELVGTALLDLLADRSRADADEALGSIAAGRPQADDHRIEAYALRAGGGEFPIEVTIRRIDRAHGSVSVAFVGDATTRRETERILAEGRDAALRTARMKSDFLATMSHELRTPMNGVIGALDLVLDSSLAPEQRELVSIAHGSAYSLLAIINDVLDLSKIEADKLAPSLVEVELPRTIEEVIDVVALPARQKGLTITSFVDPDLPRWLLADPRLIRQVLVNLVGNAVKFTASGRVGIRAESARSLASTETVLFSVEDSGAGIPPEALPTLFDAFTQVDATTTREHGGTGLGLAIASRLVRLMGGELRASSQEGSGSVFSFILELERAARADAPADGRSADHRRVLLIEPNLGAAEGVSRYLAAWGMDIDHAADAETAEQLLAVAPPDRVFDCVILSTDLPGTDVGELVQRLRRRLSPRAIRVVGLADVGAALPPLTAIGGPGARDREDTFDVVVTKPVKESRLFDALVSGTGAPSPPAPAGPPEDEPRRALGTILLAEDNHVNQRVLSAQLARLGFAIDCVANGRDAVDAFFERGPFAAVLMDCQMPVMDGYHATVAIRDREDPARPRTLIVAVTANAMQEDRDRCLASGMDEYVTKPVTMEGLATVLGPVLAAGSPLERATDAGLGVTTGSYVAPTAIDRADVGRLALDLGDEATFRRIGRLFLEELDAGVVAIEEALRDGVPDAVARRSHRLKSSAATFGARELAALLARLDEAGSTDDLSTAGRLGFGLRPEADRVHQELETLIAGR